MVAKPGCHGNTVAAAPAAGEGHLSACRLVDLPSPGQGPRLLRSSSPSSWPARLSPGNPRLSFLTPGWAGCLAATAQALGEVIFC